MSSSSSDFDSDVDFSDDSELDVDEGTTIAKISGSISISDLPESKTLDDPVQTNPSVKTDSTVTADKKEIKLGQFPSPPAPVKPNVKSQRPSSLSRIPLLNKETTNQNTYDIDRLMNPKVQKSALRTLGLEKRISLPKYKNISLESRPNAAPKTTDVADRLLADWEKIKNKKSAQKEQAEKEELEKCTFKPVINTQARSRTHEEFYDDMKRFLDDKLNRIKNKQEENEQLIRTQSQELPFRPSLCPNSIKIESMKSGNNYPRYEKLYQLHKSKDNQGLQSALKEKSTDSMQLSQSTEDSQILFHPSVNERSKKLIRNSSIENILYEDALRRHNKSLNPSPIRIQNKIISDKSEKVLMEKLKNDFEDGWIYIDIDNTKLVSYTRMLEVLRSMHFLANPKKQEESRLLTLELWKYLETSSKPPTKESLFVIINAIMGFYQPWMENPEKYPNRINLSEATAKKLHLKYSLLYDNRLSVVNKSTANKTYKESLDCTFRPQLSVMSERLATLSVDSRRSSSSLATELHREKILLQEKQAALKLKFEALDSKECTFAPRIKDLPKTYQQSKTTEKETLSKDYKNILNSAPNKVDRAAALFSLASLEKNKKENKYKPFEEQELEKNKNELTFKPKLYTREEPDAVPDEQPGVQEMVARLRYARKDQENDKNLREKGWTRSPENDVKQNIVTQETRGRKLSSRPPQKQPDKSAKDKETKKIFPKESKNLLPKSQIPKPSNHKIPIPLSKEKPESSPHENIECQADPIHDQAPCSSAPPSELFNGFDYMNDSGSSLENGKFISNEVIYEDEEMENISDEDEFNGGLEQFEEENEVTEGNEETLYGSEDENDLHIEINLGNGKTEHLNIKEGMDLEEVVEDFAKQHGITVESKLKILQLVKNLPAT
ncbi:unnamed protein product [Blepharisma stoltei]|uniref:Uncharacterized protein n=1 Tax=Blepharisma stoltei TaxID=1481888 RepID=A0AAU9I7G5_9CILI|nr:unnamed protein product [Blepharisma stoltei]